MIQLFQLRGGSRGGSLGSNEPPFCRFIRLTGSLLVPAAFDTQRWRASPVWLLYNLLRAIQFNMHAVQFFYLVQLTKVSFT